LASRCCSSYEDLLDWTAEVRSAPIEDGFGAAQEVLAAFGRQPIEEFRRFVTRTVEAFDGLPSYLAAPEPKERLELTLELTVRLPDELQKQFVEAMRKGYNRDA